jgi:polyisoprenoid-binding protein YceI
MSRKVLQALLLVPVVSAFALSSSAQEKRDPVWRVDPNRSVSRLAIGASKDPSSSEDPNSVFAVAQVRGAIHVDSSASPNSSVFFEVFPADPAAPAAAGAPSVADTRSDPSSYPTLTFRSHDIRIAANGTLEAAGELTVTYVELPVTLNPNEGYSGPVYSEPVVHTITRPVTFVLDESAADLASASEPLELWASASVSTEDFPGVEDVLIDANWPPVAQNKNCETLSDANEGYQGVVCNGIALTAPKSHEVTTTVSEEDYPGLDTARAPEGDKIFITLDLQLSIANQTPERRPAD